MADDFQDFFAENTQWVARGEKPTPSAMPPIPPKSRKEMRRKRKRAQYRGAVKILLVVLALALVATCGWFAYGELKSIRHANAARTSQIVDYDSDEATGSVEFSIEEGEGVAQIAQKLTEADIVKSSTAFTQAVANAGNPVLYPGTFQLQQKMSARNVLAILSDSSKAGGFVEVKAGERVSDVIANIVQMSGIDQSEFDSIVNSGGSGILPSEANGHFEGWLEPGSYGVKNKSASDILKAMVDKRVAKLDGLGVPSGADRERIMIIASIAEAEVNRPEYYGKVSRVIENRLQAGMPLGMDSTVAYGANTSPSKLTDAMLNDASNAYNTRINKGLPPSPISNPGDNAIQAAMNPEEGNWLYFVTTNLQTGETKFVATEAEFWKIRDEYKSANANAN